MFVQNRAFFYVFFEPKEFFLSDSPSQFVFDISWHDMPPFLVFINKLSCRYLSNFTNKIGNYDFSPNFTCRDLSIKLAIYAIFWLENEQNRTFLPFFAFMAIFGLAIKMKYVVISIIYHQIKILTNKPIFAIILSK
jgi:hypothetical protein